MTLSEEARKQYQYILDGREGRWFDDIEEYRQLKQEWFDKYGLPLIEALEEHERGCKAN